MPWERRGKRNYFYRSHRDDQGRVRKRYYGSGPAANLAAKQDAERQAVREEDAMALRQLETTLATKDALATALYEQVIVLFEAEMLVAGYHRQNYGPWRKRRATHG